MPPDQPLTRPFPQRGEGALLELSQARPNSPTDFDPAQSEQTEDRLAPDTAAIFAPPRGEQAIGGGTA